MKKVNVKTVKHGNKSYLTITAQDSNNTSNPLLLTYERDTKKLIISCRGGCSLDLDSEQISELNEFMAEIDNP